MEILQEKFSKDHHEVEWDSMALIMHILSFMDSDRKASELEPIVGLDVPPPGTDEAHDKAGTAKRRMRRKLKAQRMTRPRGTRRKKARGKEMKKGAPPSRSGRPRVWFGVRKSRWAPSLPVCSLLPCCFQFRSL
ncbi:unnamed protein product [Linum trigynum]|uniref:Uncharacterized protein n=1 Tax=Linum trigynum TaxID=586398 RepID=A0AAV2E116_9ROSI